MKIERRFTPAPAASGRAVSLSGDGRKVRGYGAVFNRLSENLGGFREVIEPGAFSAVLQDDVRALWNHNASDILARTKSGTLKIGVDSVGLWYEFEAPDTTAGRDLLVSLKRGDVDQSSFGFIIAKDRWTEGRDGVPRRTILKVARLLDVSPVTYPAYPDTSVALNSLKSFRGESPDIYDWRLRAINLHPKW